MPHKYEPIATANYLASWFRKRHHINKEMQVFQRNYSEIRLECISSHAVHEGHRYGLYYVAVTRCESPLESLCNPTLLEWNTTDSSQCEQQECGPSSSAADFLS